MRTKASRSKRTTKVTADAVIFFMRTKASRSKRTKKVTANAVIFFVQFCFWRLAAGVFQKQVAKQAGRCYNRIYIIILRNFLYYGTKHY